VPSPWRQSVTPRSSVHPRAESNSPLACCFTARSMRGTRWVVTARPRQSPAPSQARGPARTLSVFVRGFTHPGPRPHGHMRLPCRFRGSLGRGSGWDAVQGSRCSWPGASAGLSWVMPAGGALVRQCRGPCFQPGQDALGTAGVKALRPLRGGLRPAWTPAAAQCRGEAAGSRRKTSSGESRLVRGTPSPSVVSGVLKHRH
jgi:hypothetical protein